MSYDPLLALIEHDKEIGCHPKTGAAFNPLLMRIRGIWIERHGAERAQPGGNSAATGQNPDRLEQAETIATRCSQLTW